MFDAIKNNIKVEATKVLLRIGVFLFYYLLLIVFGALIFVAAFYFSKVILIYVIPEVESGRIAILLLLAILGIWCLAGMFGLYLIKPIFSFTKNSKPDRVEISENDCPELFTVIYDLADSVNCKRPKHVYLTTDVNACVFYNTSFWSIFFPVRKNLEIGLGLFDGTSKDELRAILAHEFGHFSQKSMKVGSTVYVTNSVLYNLIYEEDWWDRLLDKWERADSAIFRGFGHITRALTNWIKLLNFKMDGFVQKSYMSLSRQMEFDADAISCSIVGKETFISAMCKIDFLSDEDNKYREYLNALISENKVVGNYFVGRKVADRLNPDSGSALRYDIPLTAPINNVKSPSRVEVKDVWSSHPSLKERLASASNFGYKSSVILPEPSMSLVSEEIQQMVSDKLFSLIKQDRNDHISVVNEKEFESWATNYISDHYIPKELIPFLAREISLFDRENLPIVESSPLTADNAQMLLDYEMAKKDLEIMQSVLDGRIDAKEISYNGVVYNKKKIPIDDQKVFVTGLEKRAIIIDAAIYKYLCDIVSENEQNKLMWAYDAIFYVQASNPKLTELQQKRDMWYKELIRPIRRNEEEYRLLCTYIADFEKHFRDVVNNCNWNLLRVDVGAENEKEMLAYAASMHNNYREIDVNKINGLFHMIDVLANMHWGLYANARKTIGTIILDNNLIYR